MPKKKVLYIVSGLSVLLIILLLLVYLPLLKTKDTINSNFNFVNSREEFDFQDGLMDIDKSKRYDYLYLKENINNPLNPTFLVICDEDDIEEQKIVDFYIVKLKRDHIFDLSWEIDYPVKHATIYDKSYSYFLDKKGEKDLSDFIDKNEDIFYDLLSPKEAQQFQPPTPPQDTNIYYGYTVEEYLEKLNQLNPEQKEDVTNFVADNMDKFTDGSPKLVIKYMIDQGYLEAK